MKRDSDCTFTWNSKSSSNNNLVNQPFSGSVVYCIVPSNIQFNCMLVKWKFRLQSCGTFFAQWRDEMENHPPNRLFECSDLSKIQQSDNINRIWLYEVQSILIRLLFLWFILCRLFDDSGFAFTSSVCFMYGQRADLCSYSLVTIL